MKTMKIIFSLLSFIFLQSCNNNESANSRNNEVRNILSRELVDVKRIVNLNAPGDTDNVKLRVSNQFIIIHYYHNKPQYVTIDNDAFGKGLAMNHYAKENKGIYFSLTDSNTLKAFGAKYLDGHNGIDVIINPNSKHLKTLELWEEYSNDGTTIDISQIMSNKLDAYKYTDGEIIDSFTLHRK
jgi:hypothetical protein